MVFNNGSSNNKNFIFDYYNKLYLNWYQYEIDEKYTKKQKLEKVINN